MPVPAGPLPDPTTNRPDTGTVTRPSLGLVSRPNGGTVRRPVSGTADPDQPGNVQ
jgi:hypothetical protein